MYENYSVLFVDYEENILRSIESGLLDEEYARYFAKSSKEVLELMSSIKVDVIVINMRMPQMDGLELLKIITEKWPLTVKIILSGYTQLPQILVTANQVDIFKFLTKPWNVDELKTVVNKALDYYIIQEENINYKKVLETKNQAYQDILKKMDEVIYNAGKSSEVLGLCGKAILGFGKKFSLSQMVKYRFILNTQDEIFDIFSQAVTNQKKVCCTNELTDLLSELILSKNPETKIIKKNKEQYKVEINAKMLEATISTIQVVFEQEIEDHGMVFNIGVEEGEKFTVSMLSPKADANNVVDEKNGLTLLDIKLNFIESIVKDALDLCHITFQGAKINGSLVIAISLEE